MSCESQYPDVDPASLDTELLGRMPNVSGQAKMYLRSAADEFFRRSTVWRDQFTTLICNEDQQIYTLPVPTVGKVAKVIDVWLGQAKISRNEEVQCRPGDQRWQQPDSRTIAFHLPITEAQTFRLSIALTIGQDNAGNAALIDEYREGILSGAMYRATMAQAQDTSDRGVALTHKALFDQAIKDAAYKYQVRVSSERRPMTRMRATLEGRRQ